MANQTQVYLVNPGLMGEAEVVKALLGPQVEVDEITVDGYETRWQKIPPDFVWEGEFGLKSAWDDKGDPFPGTWSLVPKEGAKSVVGRVKFGSQEEFKETVSKLDFWNYHDRSKNPDTNEKMPEWYKFNAIKTEQTSEGTIVYITEQLTDTNLEPADENYRETESYKKARGVMARQANEYREGSENKPESELEITTLSTEIKD